MLRVAVDARIEYGRVGGVQQGLVAIANALGAVAGARDLDLVFVTYEGLDDWFRPHVPTTAEVVAVPPGRPVRVARALRGNRAGRVAARAGAAALARTARPRAGTGTFEATGADVVLFTTQTAELVEVPFVYVPHDLQHRHLPELFSAAERRRREVQYRAYCRAASVVVAFTPQGADDVVEAYDVARERVAVIAPWAPAGTGSVRPRDRAALAGRAGSESFALFPAQGWAHKNHAALFDALALLRAEGLDVPLVCSGATDDHARRLRTRAARAGVGDLVRFPGYVDDHTMRRLWAQARCMVFPSLHEGWGYPVLEAFEAGVPVACSSGPTLDAVAADGAVRFEPTDPRSIADALRRIWCDEDLRSACVLRGDAHVKSFSWRKMGESYADALERASRSGRPSAAGVRR